MTYPEGIDVSIWQKDIHPFLPGRSLVIVKISQADFLDPRREQHYAAAVAANPEFIGGYHWLDPEPPAAAQAALYLRNVPAGVHFHNVDVEGRILRDVPNARAMARTFIQYIHDHDDRPVLQYSSRGTWPGDNGQDGNWVADYTGDPERLSLRLRRQSIPWVIWQYTSRPLDRDVYKADELTKLLRRNTKPPKPPVLGGPKVKYIQISAADAATLPSVELSAGTRIETFDGVAIDTIGPTKLRGIPGLVDGHTNRQAVVINTGAVYADKVRRLTILVAIAP